MLSEVLSAAGELSSVGTNPDPAGVRPPGGPRRLTLTAVSRRRFPRTVGVVAAVYLAAMAVVFALLSAQDAEFARTADRAQGTVVALVARAPLGSTRDAQPEARSPSLAPKVSYVVDGRTYLYVAAHGRYRQRLQVGDTVTVLYAPSDPTSARLRGEGMDLGPVYCAGFGVAALLLVLVLVRFRDRPRAGRPHSGTPRAGTPRSASVAD